MEIKPASHQVSRCELSNMVATSQHVANGHWKRGLRCAVIRATRAEFQGLTIPKKKVTYLFVVRIFIYFWAVLGLCCCMGVSLVTVSRLHVVVSVAAEHTL